MGGAALALWLDSRNSPAVDPPAPASVTDPALSDLPQAAPAEQQAIEVALAEARLSEFDLAIQRLAALVEHGSEPAVEEALFLLARTQYEAGDPAAAAASLDSYLAGYPDSPAAARARLLRAEARIAVGSLDGAIEDLVAYVSADGPAAAYAYRRLGDVSVSVGDSVTAVSSYRSALQGGLGRYEESRVMLEISRLLDHQGDLAGALYWAERTAVSTPSTRDRVNALSHVKGIAMALGDSEAWQSVALRLASDFPEYSPSAAALNDLLEHGVYVEPGVAARLYIEHGSFGAAEEQLLSAVTQGDGAVAAEAAYLLGIMRQLSGDFEAALAWFRQSQPPVGAEYAFDHQWRSHQTAVETGEEGASQALEAFIGDHPGTIEAVSGIELLARSAERGGDSAEAAGYWLVAAEAAEAAEDYARAASAARTAGRLWQESGDDVLAAGALERATDLGGASFVALRAADDLSEIGEAGRQDAFYAETPVDDWLAAYDGGVRFQNEGNERALGTVQELWAVAERGTGDAIMSDLAGLGRYNPGALLAMARQASMRGQVASAAEAADVLVDRVPPGFMPLPAEVGALAYPRPFVEFVSEEADANEVDSNLVYALMKQESYYRPRAHSIADARGLTQVIPSTAYEIAGDLGVSGFELEHLYKPPLSIRFGTYYLGVQLEAFDGDPYAALAAYNGGPGNAARWGEGGGSTDPDVFVANIDFGETQNYVRRVMENLAHYRALYPEAGG